MLAVSDQPDGAAICAELYGARMGYVPYIMPGFALAKKAAEVFDRDPTVEGLILEKHGIFTFGATARECYERMIEMVSLAEGRLKKGRKLAFPAARLPRQVAPLADVAPIVRGLAAIPAPGGRPKRVILEFRDSPAVMAYVNGRDLARYSQVGVVTPDHTIRTKNWPVILPAPRADGLDAFRDGAKQAFDSFAARYHDYFRRNNRGQASPKTELDPMPRVVLVPGLGLFGVGESKSAARIAADIAESTVTTITAAESIGRYECVERTRHVRYGILVARTGQARQGGGEAARPSCGGGDRRRLRHRSRHRAGLQGGRRRSRHSRPRSQGARCRRARREMRSGRLRRDRRRVGA